MRRKPVRRDDYLDSLQHDDKVIARTGRYVDGLLKPDWSDWTEFEIHVERRANGEISTLALKNFEWAEYGCESYNFPSEFHPFGCFEAEGYYLEIKPKS